MSLNVDDSSTDNSWDIVSHYAENEPKIKVVRNSGNGIIHALRKAYEKCQGDSLVMLYNRVPFVYNPSVTCDEFACSHLR